MQQKNKVLFWDFHGTLTTPEITWFEIASEAASEIAPEQPLSQETLQKHLSFTCLPWYEIENRDASHLKNPEDWWAFCEDKFTKMFEKCGFAHEESVQMASKVRLKSIQAKRYHLYPDAIDTLVDLKNKGYKQYILSNNLPELEDIVREMGILKYFDGVFTSALIGYDKPRSEIFDHARGVLQDGQEPWMIGDNRNDDIIGGNNAGFVTVLVHSENTGDAKYYAENLLDICSILQ